jgi:hypothetical protein
MAVRSLAQTLDEAQKSRQPRSTEAADRKNEMTLIDAACETKALLGNS